MFQSSKQELYIPNDDNPLLALRRCTHLAIAAHQDDIEIMAIDGILQCYQNSNQHFCGCTVTDGRGTPRAGEFEDVRDDEMAKIRHEEQKAAARIGQYVAQVMLGYASAQVRQQGHAPLATDLDALLQATQPQIVYTHNLADKHNTHLAVVLRVIEAIRRMSPELRPQKLYGCEVWRSLDFLPDKHKVIFDVSAHPQLQTDLLRVYRSQIAGGKDYESAVIGRRHANATFQNPYKPDEANRVALAMDLTPLIQDDDLSPYAYLQHMLSDLESEIEDSFGTL